jgi:hypothetical protein
VHDQSELQSGSELHLRLRWLLSRDVFSSSMAVSGEMSWTSD